MMSPTFIREEIRVIYMQMQIAWGDHQSMLVLNENLAHSLSQGLDMSVLYWEIRHLFRFCLLLHDPWQWKCRICHWYDILVARESFMSRFNAGYIKLGMYEEEC